MDNSLVQQPPTKKMISGETITNLANQLQKKKKLNVADLLKNNVSVWSNTHTHTQRKKKELENQLSSKHIQSLFAINSLIDFDVSSKCIFFLMHLMFLMIFLKNGDSIIASITWLVLSNESIFSQYFWYRVFTGFMFWDLLDLKKRILKIGLYVCESECLLIGC